jgi:hypothetical protein
MDATVLGVFDDLRGVISEPLSKVPLPSLHLVMRHIHFAFARLV